MNINFCILVGGLEFWPDIDLQNLDYIAQVIIISILVNMNEVAIELGVFLRHDVAIYM